MSEDGLRQDVQFLAGRLPHRGANTDNERLAAEYLLDRFSAYSPQSAIDDFYSIDTHGPLFASYYLEFFVVALIALWSPMMAFIYGVVVFVVYMAEFTGYGVLSRLLPQFETQNVSAHFMGTSPKKSLIVTAHYDSPKATLIKIPTRIKWLRTAHTLVVLCMTAVLISCAAEAFGVFHAGSYRVDLWIRWGAVSALIAAAAAFYTSEMNGEFVRGAISNASGVAVLLHLAKRFQEEPLESVDVWLVATGSKETWMSGMRQFLRGMEIDPETTYFINVAHVGAGTLRYVEGEGMMHVFPSSKELLELARQEAAEFRASPITYRGLPTDALLPLARGYKTLGIMATGTDGLPKHLAWYADTVANVEFKLLQRAAGFTEAIIRRLDETC